MSGWLLRDDWAFGATMDGRRTGIPLSPRSIGVAPRLDTIISVSLPSSSLSCLAAGPGTEELELLSPGRPAPPTPPVLLHDERMSRHSMHLERLEVRGLVALLAFAVVGLGLGLLFFVVGSLGWLGWIADVSERKDSKSHAYHSVSFSL